MALGIDDLAILAIVAALGGAAAYEYIKANPSLIQSSSTSTEKSSAGTVTAAQPYVNQPPLLYDPVIYKLPHATIDYQYANPYLVLNPETGEPEYGGGTTVVNQLPSAPQSSAPSGNMVLPSNPSQAASPVVLPASPSQAASPVVSALNYKLYEINTNLQHMASSNQYTSAGIADMLAKQYNNLIKEFGPLPAHLYNGYSAGSNGYATVPIYNSEGKIISVVAVNNATEGKYSNVNPISTTGNPYQGTYLSANQVISSTPPNTVIGYTQTNGQGTQFAKTYSAGSTWQGPGEYISATGAPSYIANLTQYNEQVKLGYLGPGTENTAYSGGYFSKSSTQSNVRTGGVGSGGTGGVGSGGTSSGGTSSGGTSSGGTGGAGTGANQGSTSTTVSTSTPTSSSSSTSSSTASTSSTTTSTISTTTIPYSAPSTSSSSTTTTIPYSAPSTPSTSSTSSTSSSSTTTISYSSPSTPSTPSPSEGVLSSLAQGAVALANSIISSIESIVPITSINQTQNVTATNKTLSVQPNSSGGV